MINIEDIISVCNAVYLGKEKHMECTNFCNDTRRIKKDDIYIGIKGETFNGNLFYRDAFDKGAKLCILDNDTEIAKEYQNHNIILVKDTVEAIQQLAKFKRDKYQIPVVAVTGSVGKTSVKDMINTVLSTKYNVLCNKGNLNNHLGVPFTILELNNHDALIVEMGMNHFGEIHLLSKIASPTIAVISTIGTAHIGILGSRENILKAKLEILDGMNDEGLLIINNDNDLLHTVKYKNLVTIGIDNPSDYMATNTRIEPFSSTFNVEDMEITIPIGSDAFIRNALLAYAVGRKLNVPKENIKSALEKLELTPHRLEKIETKKYTIIDDTYNASLDSIKNAAELLNRVNQRKVFIFADILELEDFSQKIHEEIGNIFIENNIDLLITVGSLSKYTYNIFKEKNNNCYHFDNNNELIKNINNIIKQNDFILLKGSHSMNLIEIVEYLKESGK